MKHILIIIPLLAISFGLTAQNIVGVEYFIDVDPGAGNATSIIVSPSAALTDVTLQLDIAEISEGVHTFYVRAQDDNGSWSRTYSKTIYKASAPPSLPNIMRIEYYIDVDPGYGAGTDVPITEAPVISEHAFAVPLNGITDGPHVLYVRAMDDRGNWSLVYSKAFNKIPVSAPTNPQLSEPVYDVAFSGQSAPVSVEATGGTPPYSVQFLSRKIADATFVSRDVAVAENNAYEAVVDGSMADELGTEFYFTLRDANGLTVETNKHYIYRAVPPEGISIPFSAFGGTAQSYEIFSIPYQPEDNLIASIFDELGEYNKSRWRLVRYQGGKNVDFSAGINRIETGKSYWFNRKENIDIAFSGGTVVQVNQSKDAIIRLEPGWNQIGNPLPFDLDWDDVLAANADTELIGNLKVFNPQGFHLNDESNTLKTWSGGFVHNGNATAVNLRIPVTLKSFSGGRKTSTDLPGPALDNDEWFVRLVVTQGLVTQKTSGVGMHPVASSSADALDDFVVPRFLKNYLELYTRHDEFFTRKFSRDIVPSADRFTWDLQFESNNTAPVTISWHPETFGSNGAALFLFDMSRNTLVDMRRAGNYRFTPLPNHRFRIMYAASGADINPKVTSFGKPYPNPFRYDVTFPLIVGNDGSAVTIDIVDNTGKTIQRLANAVFSKGIYDITWDGLDGSHTSVPSGLYVCRINVGGLLMAIRIVKK